MIHSLAGRLASIFVLYGESSVEDVDIYTYACEAIISTLVNITISITILLFFGRIIDGAIFMLVFTILRKFTGGHHADTHIKCILTFNVILVCALLISDLLAASAFENVAVIFIATVSLIGIFVLAPVGNENKPLDEIWALFAKKRGRWLTSALWIICIMDIYILNIQIGFIISLSMFSVFGSLAYAIKYNSASEREVIHYEKAR